MQGSTYTRWGHDTCPSTATLVYKGSMAGTYFNNKGAGANHLCLPFDPEFVPGVGDFGGSYIHGSEYQSVNLVNSRKQVIENRNIPCAVCRVQMRSTALMVPAHNTCPHGWKREYYGFLMGAHHTHTKRNFICMDREMKTLPGHADDKKGNELYTVGTSCAHGLECPPYQVNKPMTCTVCTKWASHSLSLTLSLSLSLSLFLSLSFSLSLTLSYSLSLSLSFSLSHSLSSSIPRMGSWMFGFFFVHAMFVF